jgi:VCBS repeat-containing protein
MWRKKQRAKRRTGKGLRQNGARRLVLESLESRNLLASLSGFVYVDHDGDGTRDTGESGVPGVQISLSGTDGSGAAVSRTVLTDDSGSYEFDDLPSGTYQISERQPTALSDGMDSTSIPNAVTANDRFSMIVLGADQSFTGNNFGERSILPRYVSIVWQFASNLASQGLFRETVARAEELAGNASLAAAIRAGGDPPDENTPPEAVDDAYTVDEDQVLTVSAASGVLANDTDADEDSLTAQLVTPPDNGTVTLNPDGSFTYTPDADFAGTDTFSYRASDGEDDSAPADVVINVTPVEDPPAIVLPAEFTDPANVPERTVGQAIDFTVDVEDPDDSDYVFQLDLEASGIPDGQAMPTIDPETGRFLWTPTATGRFEIRVIVVNGEGEADQETFLIDIVSA